MKRRRAGSLTVAIGYLRASTDRQELSPDVQRRSIVEWAASAGVTIASWHEDRGVSGSTPLEGRPGLLAALGAVREAGAGFLVVARRDRLARDPVVAALTERAAEAAGARVLSADGSGNGTTPADAFMRSVLDAASAYERALIQLRTRQALAEKKARGEKLGGEAPFGSQVGPDGRTLVPHEDEQRVVQRVRRLRADGVSLRAVVAQLAAEGVTSRSGKPLGLTQVARIAA